MKISSQRNQETEAEDSNACASEEETDDNDNNPPIIAQDTYMKGTIADVIKHPLLNLFKVPMDNNNTLHRLHFKLLQVLKNKDNDVDYACSINNSKITHVILTKSNIIREL